MRYNYSEFIVLVEELDGIEAQLNHLADQINKNPVLEHDSHLNAMREDLFFKRNTIKNRLEQHAIDHPKHFYIYSRMPKALWYELFDHHVDDNITKLVGKEFKEITENDLPSDKKQALILLMLCFPDKSEDDYIDIMALAHLPISDKDLFYAYAALNRVDRLDLLDQSVLTRIPKNDYLKIFNLACDLNHIDTLNWLSRHVAPQLLEEIITTFEEAFHRAYMHHHFTTMQWLIDHATLPQRENLITANGAAVFDHACINRDLGMIQWLLSHVGPRQKEALIARKDYKILQLAASAGRLDIIQWIFTHASLAQKMDILTAKNYEIFFKAMDMNRRDVFNWLHSQLTPEQAEELTQETSSRIFLKTYSINGGIEKMQTVLSHATPELKNAMIEAYGNKIFHHAMLDQNVGVMQCLLENATPMQKAKMIAIDNYSPFGIAASNGRLDVMKLLFVHAAPEQRQLMIIGGNFDALKRARSFGNQEVVEWLMQFPEVLAFTNAEFKSAHFYDVVGNAAVPNASNNQANYNVGSYSVINNPNAGEEEPRAVSPANQGNYNAVGYNVLDNSKVDEKAAPLGNYNLGGYDVLGDVTSNKKQKASQNNYNVSGYTVLDNIKVDQASNPKTARLKIRELKNKHQLLKNISPVLKEAQAKKNRFFNTSPANKPTQLSPESKGKQKRKTGKK